ncbi:MAG: hypothetical protein KDH09_12820 [Chrysiogenetes bacterium]|nr:hypothetical protein [Chrysiogenetes bacterium]
MAAPVVQVGDLQGAEDPEWRLGRVSVPDLGRHRRFHLRAGDVAIATKGAGFRTALVPARWAGAILTGNLIGIRARGEVLPELLHAWLSGEETRWLLESRATGSRLLNISLKSITEVPVPVLPMAEQERLAELLRASREQSEQALLASRLRTRISQKIVADALRGAESSDIGGNRS